MKRSGIEVRCGKQRGALRVAMRSEKEEKMTSKQRAYLKSRARRRRSVFGSLKKCSGLCVRTEATEVNRVNSVYGSQTAVTVVCIRSLSCNILLSCV